MLPEMALNPNLQIAHNHGIQMIVFKMLSREVIPFGETLLTTSCTDTGGFARREGKDNRDIQASYLSILSLRLPVQGFFVNRRLGWILE
jgi:hypothetical protein